MHLDRARSLAAQEKHEDALAALRAAVALHRGDVEISREYQNALVRLGRREEAVKEYRALAEAFPDEATWHYLYGRLLDGDPFEKEMQRALDLAPAFFWAHFGLGQFRLERGRAREALPHLKSARDLRPDLLETHDALAKAYYAAGNYSQDRAQADLLWREAERIWSEALKNFPDSSVPPLRLGVMYKTIGQADPSILLQAVAQLQTVVRKWPDTWEAYEPLIQACYAAGETGPAEENRGRARDMGKRLKKKDLIVEVVDLATRVMIVREILDAGPGEPWLRVTLAAKGKDKFEESPAALAFPAGKEGLDVFLADASKPDGRGALVQRFEKAPPHAALVARLKIALGK